MLRVGVIGYGYWGPNLVRNFCESGVSRVSTVSDLDETRLAAVKIRYPTIETTTDHREPFSDPSIDAIAIATPVGTHFDLAIQALEAGKHVLVEKPLTETSDQGRRLIDEADRRGLVLMVDHTFIFTGAVRKIRELVENGELGEIYYYDSARVNLGLFQHDVSVIWDLAVHDLAIIDYVFGKVPTAISATGMSHVPGKPANIAYLSMFFDSSMIANIHVNWLAPVKLRRTLIGGSRKMIVYDDLEPSEKIKVYDKGITVRDDRESLYESLIGYRTGDMWAPQLETVEALRAEAKYFVECIEQGKRPINDGVPGLNVVRVLEAATQSMGQRGHPVELT